MTWASQIASIGWVQAEQADKGKFADFLESRKDLVSDLEQCLALSVDNWDPSKNIGEESHVIYLSRFIRPVPKSDAIRYLRGYIFNENGRQATNGKLAELLFDALVKKEILSFSGESCSISQDTRQELRDIPPKKLLQANDGVVSVEDFVSCGIKANDAGDIIDNYVVDLKLAELDEEGLLRLTKQHVGGSTNNDVSLEKLDRWSINDNSVLANIFQKALDSNPLSNTRLNEARDTLILAPPTKNQLAHLRDTLLKKREKLIKGVTGLSERDKKMRNATDHQRQNGNKIEREKITLESEGSKLYIRLQTMREASKFFENEG